MLNCYCNKGIAGDIRLFGYRILVGLNFKFQNMEVWINILFVWENRLRMMYMRMDLLH